MKKILLIATLLYACGTQAQNLIALEHNGTQTFHEFLDSAMYYAADGDYIYLSGGLIKFNFTPNDFIIDKAVNIVGVGYHPDSTIALGATKINKAIIVINTASGGSLEGISIPGGYSMVFGNSSTNSNVKNYLVKRCYIEQFITIGFYSYVQSSNIHILECILHNGGIISYNNAVNVSIEKSVIESSVSGYGFNGVFWEGVIFKNNIFINNNRGGDIINTIRNATFENNIFYYNPTKYNLTSGLYNCYFTHNIFVYDSAYIPLYSVGNSNTFSNNFYNISLSSIFQKTPSTTGFTFNDNYHLKSSCVGVGAGSDGKDIGIYGTSLPFKDGGTPANPHIVSKSIDTQTDASGKLPIKIKVKAQNH